MRKRPPRKEPGDARGRRRIDGEVLDVPATTSLLGNKSEKQTRSQIARNLIPARRFGGRIIVLRSELLAYLQSLPRVVELPQ